MRSAMAGGTPTPDPYPSIARSGEGFLFRPNEAAGIHDGSGDVWYQAPGGKPARRVTDFRLTDVIEFGANPGGRRFFFSRGRADAEFVRVQADW